VDYKTGDILVKDKMHYFYFGRVVFAHALKSLCCNEGNKIVYVASLVDYTKIDVAIASASCCYKAVKVGSIKQEISGLERTLHFYTAALHTPHKASAKKVLNNEIGDIKRLISAKSALIDDGAAQRLIDVKKPDAIKSTMYYYYHYIPVTAASFGAKAELINYHIVHILYYELTTAVRRGIQLTPAFSPWFRDLITTLERRIPALDCRQAKAELDYQMSAFP